MRVGLGSARAAGTIILFLGCLPAGALGQEAPVPDKSGATLLQPTPDSALRDMDTDRPNHTNTPHTIDAGHVQIETGIVDFSRQRDQSNGGDTDTDSWGFGQVDVRLGLTNRLELNVAFNAFADQTTKDLVAKTSSRAEGFGDVTTGFKLNFWGDDGSDGIWSTAFAIQPQVKIPTAQGSLGNGHVEVFVGTPFLVNLPYGIHLGLETTLSAERNDADTGYLTGWQNSVSIDRTLIAKADFYVEYWSEAYPGRALAAKQTIDAGLTYPLTDKLQLDSGFNFGLNRASPSFEWLAGVSVRY